MKRLLLLLLIFNSISVLPQQIEIGTTFTIQFKDLKGNMDFEIVSSKPFKDKVDISNLDSIFQSEATENQIIGIFANGKSGQKTTSMLVLQSGLDDYIDYDLEIKLPDTKKFQKTTSSTLFKGVKSVEYWPYPIEQLVFEGFKVIPKETFETVEFEVKVDSTCIKNPDKNIASGEKEFKSHLGTIISKFEGRTSYFYTKKGKETKVVSYNWRAFKESDPGVNPEIEKDLGNIFNQKFEFVLNTVCNYLGSQSDTKSDIPIQ